MEQQDTININVQERLRRLEASNEIISAFLFATCETHQDKDLLRNTFLLRSEILISRMLSRELPEDYIDSATAYREALLLALDRTKP